MTEEDILMGRDIKRVEWVLNKVKNDMRRFHSIKEIKIDNTHLEKLEHNFTKRDIYMPVRTTLNDQYVHLLKNKIKDNFMRNQSIRYADIIVQPRLFCQLRLITDKGNNPVLKIIATLLEHGQVFANFWTGKQIDSLTFAQLVMVFKRELSPLGVGEVLIESYPSMPCKVRSCHTLWTIA